MLEFKKSTRKGKKYSVVYNGKIIHFGSIFHKQYRDSTGLGLYSYLDHNDLKRRQSYLTRSKGIRDKQGNLTYNNKNSPNYYSYHFLWM